METIQERYKKHIESFRHVITEAVKTKFDMTEEITPVVFALIIKNDKLAITVLEGLAPFFAGGNTGKDLASEVIKQITKEIKPVAMAFVCEGWAVEVDPEKKGDFLNPDGSYKDPEFNASEHPDKKEIVFINFETYLEDSKLSWYIEREGEEVWLREQVNVGWEPKTNLSSGRFSNLLEDNYSEFAKVIEKELETRMN